MNRKRNLLEISYWSVFFACALLPLKTTLSNFFLILLFSLSVLSFFINGLSIELLKKPKFYLGTTLILIIPIALGCFYALNFDKALGELGKNIFYFLLPFVALRKDIEWHKMLSFAIYGLALGGVISILFLHSINFYNFLSLNLPFTKLFSYRFTGLSFIEPIKDMHTVYIGIYYLFMIVGIWQPFFKLRTWLKSLITVITILTILFLNSRSVLIAGIILFIVYGMSLIKPMKIVLVVFLTGALLIIAHPFYSKTYVYNKLVNGTYWELTNNVGTNNTDSKKTSDSRMSRWIVAKDFIMKRPFFGYGTNSEKEMLLEGYKIREMKLSQRYKYDSHNQYLSYTLQYGIFGLVFLILFLSFNTFKGVKNKDKLLLSFILIIAIVSLTENFFNRNMGINFVALLSTLLFNIELRKV